MLLLQPTGTWLLTLPWRCRGHLSLRALRPVPGPAAASCNCTAAPEPTQGFLFFLSFPFFPSPLQMLQCKHQDSYYSYCLPPFSNDRDEVKAVRLFFFITDFVSLFFHYLTACVCVAILISPNSIPAVPQTKTNRSNTFLFLFLSPMSSSTLACFPTWMHVWLG